jgi:hypothetical protein
MRIDMSVLEYKSVDMINDFTLIEEIENYDRAANPLKLSVYELLPIGVKWNYKGREYEIQNGHRLTAKLLNDRKHIAIIEVHDNKPPRSKTTGIGDVGGLLREEGLGVGSIPVAGKWKRSKLRGIEPVLRNKNSNEAYIVDGTNNQKYNIGKLLNGNNLESKSPHIIGENNRIKLNMDTLIFDDVYYINQELYFYAVVGNEDYRFSFDLETGKMGELTISR